MNWLKNILKQLLLYLNRERKKPFNYKEFDVIELKTQEFIFPADFINLSEDKKKEYSDLIESELKKSLFNQLDKYIYLEKDNVPFLEVPKIKVKIFILKKNERSFFIKTH